MEYIVKDLMVPISEYATVAKGSTLFEAVLALEKAQEEYDHSKYHHRAVLCAPNVAAQNRADCAFKLGKGDEHLTIFIQYGDVAHNCSFTLAANFHDDIAGLIERNWFVLSHFFKSSWQAGTVFVMLSPDQETLYNSVIDERVICLHRKLTLI